jgi:hypothetical protein
MEGSNMISPHLVVNKDKYSSWQHISKVLEKVTNELQRKCSIGVVNSKDDEVEGGDDAKQ